jgi:UDP-2,3-diacylglucosamine hydrolase
MHERPVYLASDVHLGAVSRAHEEAFFAWMRHAAAEAGRIVINGDLFDFWFEYRSGIPAGYDAMLALLADIVRGGTPVTLMGGNHDWWGGRYLREEIGLEFLQDPVVRELGGLRTLLAHGDGLGRGDFGYRALKWLLRGRATRFGFGLLGPRLGGRIAAAVSQTETRQAERTRAERERAEALEAWALAQLEAAPDLHLVVLGHTHTPRLREVGPGRWYVNAGDWVEHDTYVVLDGGGAPPRLVAWGA